MDYITIKNLKIFAHHGVFEQETENGQNFYVNAKLYVDMERAGTTDALDDAVNYGEVCLFLESFLKEHTYKLLEKAVTETMQAVLVQFPAVNGLELELSKPQAPIPLSFETVSVTRSLFWHKVYLGIGSNLGDKKEFMDQAVEKMKLDQAFRKLRTSDWIVTEPYGGVEQDDFLNGAVMLRTLRTPEELLELIGEIERSQKRERIIHWGPRTVDLDILLYDQEIILEAAHNSTEAHKVMWDTAIEEAVKEAQETMGVEFVYDVDKEAFREATQPMIEAYEEQYPGVKTLMDTIEAAREGE